MYRYVFHNYTATWPERGFCKYNEYNFHRKLPVTVKKYGEKMQISLVQFNVAEAVVPAPGRGENVYILPIGRKYARAHAQ